MRRFFPITRKVTLIIVVSLIVGIGGTIFYFAYTQNLSLERTNEESLEQQSDILYQSIQNAMLPGEAPIAVSLLEDLKSINPAYEIILLRANGVEAFSDNDTIAMVNANFGYQAFEPKEIFQENRMIMADDYYFSESVNNRKKVLFQFSEQGKQFFTIYKPLLNLPKCSGCHGQDHTVRGVIDITADITTLVSRQRLNLSISGGIFIGIVVLLSAVLAQFLHGAVIRPVKHIGTVCSEVTRGEFNVQVDIRNNDEIGVLGDTVNKMVQGLYERFQLSKFVSTSTIQSIQDREKGAKEEMTLFFSDIRSFTAFSERRSPEEVVESLNKVLNIQTELVHKYGGDVDKYVGDEIVAIYSGPDKEYHACRTALEIQREIMDNPKLYGNLEVGIGIDTGEVIMGLVGSEQRADFTVIGDHVNNASRLCSAAKAGQVVVSDSTYTPIRSRAEAKGPFRIKVKGKENYQRVHMLMSLGTGE